MKKCFVFIYRIIIFVCVIIPIISFFIPLIGVEYSYDNYKNNVFLLDYNITKKQTSNKIINYELCITILCENSKEIEDTIDIEFTDGSITNTYRYNVSWQATDNKYVFQAIDNNYINVDYSENCSYTIKDSNFVNIEKNKINNIVLMFKFHPEKILKILLIIFNISLLIFTICHFYILKYYTTKLLNFGVFIPLINLLTLILALVFYNKFPHLHNFYSTIAACHIASLPLLVYIYFKEFPVSIKDTNNQKIIILRYCNDIDLKQSLESTTNQRKYNKIISKIYKKNYKFYENIRQLDDIIYLPTNSKEQKNINKKIECVLLNWQTIDLEQRTRNMTLEQFKNELLKIYDENINYFNEKENNDNMQEDEKRLDYETFITIKETKPCIKETSINRAKKIRAVLNYWDMREVNQRTTNIIDVKEYELEILKIYEENREYFEYKISQEDNNKQ